MASIFDPGQRPIEDLTARARILDAALEQFAEHGFAGATMKRIADAAGVSVGLVQHHFGTKAGLRQACDDAVVEVLRDRKLEATRDDSIGDPGVLAGLMAASPLLLRYVGRAFVERSPSMVELYDHFASGTEEWLTAQWPERFPPGAQRTLDVAAVITALNAARVVLEPLVAQRVGLTPWVDITSPRMGRALFDAYAATGEYLASPVGQRIRAALDELLDRR
jgi:AcrR family transcriptional regulator